MPEDINRGGMQRERERESKRDVGTGAGTAAGGAAGMAGGAAVGAATGTATGGPIGTAIGGVVGAAAGAAAGRAMGDKGETGEGVRGGDYNRNLEQYIGYDVVDRNDNKIGTLDCLWSDHTGEPAFVGVRTGWLFGKTHVVPAQSVEVSRQYQKIRLPYTEEKVKDAPAFDADAEMTWDKEREVYRYYGIEGATAGVRERATAPLAQERGQEEANIQLSEEQLRVGKREVETGGVRLRKIVRTETVNQPVELQREDIVIERVPAEGAATARAEAFEQQEIYIPLRREEAVVQKEARITGEVRARKTTETEREQISEQVRKEEVEVERSGEEASRLHPTEAAEATAASRLREREERPRSQRLHGK